MKIKALALGLLAFAACSHGPAADNGECLPDNGWLFTGNGPYTLETKVDAAPGPASFRLVTDLSLMSDEPRVVLESEVNISADSTVNIALGMLQPGFYQVRLRDSVRWNIGVRPLEVLSPPDEQPDFDSFWNQTLEELDAVPFEPVYTLIPDYSNEIRTCYEVRYTSLGGAETGGIVSIPNEPGKYPVYIQYMGYGAEPFYFDPSADPDRIDMLVSVRRQGIFKKEAESWISDGIADKYSYYYRGAFCDVKRAVDFAVSMEQADPERIVALGESQGGAFTGVAASLDKRIRAASLAVPFLGDYPDYAKIVWWPVHEVFDRADAEGIGREDLLVTLSYFDLKNFASRITCPVIMAFGLQDETCPPHTNFSIYNNIPGTDKRYVCIPTCGHAIWMEGAWPPVRDAFLKSKLQD